MSRKSQRVVLKSQARELISRVYDFMKNEAGNNYAENVTDTIYLSQSTVTRILRERKKYTNTINQTICYGIKYKHGD